MDLIGGLIFSGYLLYLAFPARADGRHGLGELQFTRKRPEIRRILLGSAGFIAGVAVAWFARAAAGAAYPTAAALIAFVLLLQRWSRAELDPMGASSLALLSRLQCALESDLSFFEALAAAGAHLPGGRLSAAVDEALERHADRLPLQACLEPLYRSGGGLRDLAVDAGQAGPGAMLVVIRSVSRRTAERWDRRGGRRRLAARLGDRIPLLLAAAAGAGLYALAAEIGEWVLIPGLIGPGLGRSERKGPALRRWAYLGSGLAASAMLLPWGTAASGSERMVQVRTYSPAVSGIVRHERLPAEPLMARRPAQVIPSEPPTRPVERPVRTCRVVTGVSGGWAHVRSAPGMDGAVRFYVREGESLVVDHMRGDWRAVRRKDGESGWIFETLCVGSTPGGFFKNSASVGDR